MYMLLKSMDSGISLLGSHSKFPTFYQEDKLLNFL